MPWGKQYVGQTQKWFAFKFIGSNSEINVSTNNPEFSEWKWSNHNLLIENIVPLLESGHVHYGENKIQEAEVKWGHIKKIIKIYVFTWSESYKVIKQKKL